MTEDSLNEGKSERESLMENSYGEIDSPYKGNKSRLKRKSTMQRTDARVKIRNKVAEKILELAETQKEKKGLERSESIMFMKKMVEN